MAHRTLPLPPLQRLRLPSLQHLSRPIPEEICCDLVLRLQVVPAGWATETVRFDHSTEGKRLSHFAAEEDHIGKVLGRRRGFGGRSFFLLAEEPAGRKDGLDGCDDNAGGREREVAGVVLMCGVNTMPYPTIHLEMLQATYNGNHSIWFQQIAKTLNELLGK